MVPQGISPDRWDHQEASPDRWDPQGVSPGQWALQAPILAACLPVAWCDRGDPAVRLQTMCDQEALHLIAEPATCSATTLSEADEQGAISHPSWSTCQG